jgi:Family of unknown function (DUF5990)
MEFELTLKIILDNPPPSVDFGLQKGAGTDYETVQTQKSSNTDLYFECAVTVKPNKQGVFDFYGPFAQGPVSGRFIYIDIGTYAGDKDSVWGRRLKIPLYSISQILLEKLSKSRSPVLETRVPGTGKDGGPNCATVKNFQGWETRKG